MELGARISKTLQAAGLSPRHLGGATRIHFVTIYRAINGNGTTLPSHEHTLTNALNKIDDLVAKGELPFKTKLSRKEKTETLARMLTDR